MNSTALEQCLRAGFINYQLNNDERYLPKILTNNSEKKLKVLEPLLYEMKKCQDFFFSVAFVTNTGVACLIDILNELKEKYLKESDSFNQTKCMEEMEKMLIETAKLNKKD